MTPAEEERHLARITERLRTKFPHATTDAIDNSVAQAYEHFDGTRIREYIPVLVERRAREALALLEAAKTSAAEGITLRAPEPLPTRSADTVPHR